MNTMRLFGFLILGFVTLIGCSKTPDTPSSDSGKSKTNELTPTEEAKIKTAFGKLSDTDRLLAEAQKFCPVQKTRLGSMGKPDRIEIDGQPVFLCCSGCADDARTEPKKTLDQIAQFKKGSR